MAENQNLTAETYNLFRDENLAMQPRKKRLSDYPVAQKERNEKRKGSEKHNRGGAWNITIPP